MIYREMSRWGNLYVTAKNVESARAQVRAIERIVDERGEAMKWTEANGLGVYGSYEHAAEAEETAHGIR